MHSELAAALSRLDAVTGDLQAAVSAVPAEGQAQKPAPERWCVNEVLEHLALVEPLFVDALVAKIVDAKAAGLGAECEAPAFLSHEMKTVVEDRSTRRSAPERVQPTGHVDAAASLETISATHTRLRAAIESCDGLALGDVTHDHRFFGTLNVYQWVDLITGHERRHLAQVREIVEQVARADG